MNQAACTSKTCLLAQALESDPLSLQQIFERDKILRNQFRVELTQYE